MNLHKSGSLLIFCAFMAFGVTLANAQFSGGGPSCDAVAKKRMENLQNKLPELQSMFIDNDNRFYRMSLEKKITRLEYQRYLNNRKSLNDAGVGSSDCLSVDRQLSAIRKYSDRNICILDRNC